MGGGGFPYKIVIGEPIAYKARKGTGTGWHWDLGDWNSGVFTPYWTGLTPQTPNSYSDDGTALIPGALVNMPVSNNDLGPAHGLIRVTDGISTAYSENVLNLPATQYKGPNTKVNIFFNKFEISPILHNGSSVPNWFHYWQQDPQILELIQTPGFKVFDDQMQSFVDGPTIEFNLKYRDDGNYHWPFPTTLPPPGSLSTIIYGSNEASNNFHFATFYTDFATDPTNPYCTSGDFRKVISHYGNIDYTINVGEGCGYINYTTDPGTGVLPSVPPIVIVEYYGIIGMKALVEHEIEHWEFFERFWQDGYDSEMDCDLDFFPQWFEDSEIGIAYGFHPMVVDNWEEYSNANDLFTKGPSTRFQEDLCRRRVVANSSHYTNNLDWSFDPSGTYQGSNY